MPRYHLNPETDEIGACRAKKQCPFGSAESHFPSKKLALVYQEKRFELEHMLESKPAPSLATTLQAIASPMIFEGTPPPWFVEGEEYGKHDPAKAFPVAPELIDTFMFEGRRVAVVWEEYSYDEGDYWFQLENGHEAKRLLFRDFETGEILAYMKTNTVSEESLKLSFGDDAYSGLRWLSGSRGNSFLTDYSKAKDELGRPHDRTKSWPADPAEELEAKLKLWKQAFVSLDRTPSFLEEKQVYMSSYDYEYGPHTLEEVDKALAEANELALELRAKTVKYHETPSPGYANVNGPYRGRGLGQALYIYTARQEAKQGRVFAAGMSQTGSAQKVWERMASDENLKEKVKIVDRWRREEDEPVPDAYLCLDFRD